jgi:hypothetical protein
MLSPLFLARVSARSVRTDRRRRYRSLLPEVMVVARLSYAELALPHNSGTLTAEVRDVGSPCHASLALLLPIAK